MLVTRYHFCNGDLSVDEVVTRYKAWLSWIFYVICVRFNYSKGDFEYSMFRSVKRGDDRYSYLTCCKFKKLNDLAGAMTYFGYGSRGYVQGSALLATFEYNSNLVSLPDAWLHVGVDFNRLMSHIRKLYGKVSVVRVFEAHESGYPHIHALLVFHDHVFNGRSMRNSRGRIVYRVFGSEFEDLKGCWSEGYSDFEMVNSFRGGVRYLGKYLAKSTSFREAGSKGVKTLTMCWILRKRSFSISGGLFSDAIRQNDISNLNSHKNSDVYFITVGFDLTGNSIVEKVHRWELFGFCKRDNVLWDDWFGHVISGKNLMRVEEGIEENRSYYDLVG